MSSLEKNVRERSNKKAAPASLIFIFYYQASDNKCLSAGWRILALRMHFEKNWCGAMPRGGAIAAKCPSDSRLN